MTGDDTARLLYLGVLGAVICLWFFAQNRASWGKVTQQAVVWALIFVGVIAAFGLWGDIRRSALGTPKVLSQNQIVIPRAPDGHYHVTLNVNDTAIAFVVDTGASMIVLTQEDAKRIGIKLEDLVYSMRANTANGVVRTAQVRLSHMELGQIRDENIRAVVNEGTMNRSLLGMSYLNRFSSIEIRGNEMIITR